MKLKPVGGTPDDISKKSEPPPLPETKPSGHEERPKPPVKKSPPSLPRKPDKPKPPHDLPINPERPPTRQMNGMDPAKRHSVAVTPTERPHDISTKRHSHGAGMW